MVGRVFRLGTAKRYLNTACWNDSMTLLSIQIISVAESMEI